MSFNNQEQLAANTYDVLQRTGASLLRSNQIAYETEQVGTEVSTKIWKNIWRLDKAI